MQSLDDFVNTNAANTTCTSYAEFESKFAYDSDDDAALPVVVYMRNSKRVAWYDCELQQGYLSPSLL